MELEIITERESSPFRHIFPAEYTNGRRYGVNLENMQLVMGEFLDILGLARDVKTLEVGAGHGQEPSKALLALGCNVSTLDADQTEHCTDVSSEEIKALGEGRLYPAETGRNGGVHYLGDIGFIGDEKSQLRNSKFDLLFYWGSIHGTDFCSSVSQSRTAYDFDKKITLRDRLVAPIPNVDANGYMSYVSGFFNSTGDPHVHPKNVMNFNGRMVDTLLLWGNYEGIKPARAIVFGLSPDFSFKYLRENAGQECFDKPTEAEIREAVDNDTIGRFMKNHWSMFSDYKAKDSSAYRKALEVFSPAQQKAISDLGLVDCVAVQYK